MPSVAWAETEIWSVESMLKMRTAQIPLWFNHIVMIVSFVWFLVGMFQTPIRHNLWDVCVYHNNAFHLAFICDNSRVVAFQLFTLLCMYKLNFQTLFLVINCLTLLASRMAFLDPWYDSVWREVLFNCGFDLNVMTILSTQKDLEKVQWIQKVKRVENQRCVWFQTHDMHYKRNQ